MIHRRNVGHETGHERGSGDHRSAGTAAHPLRVLLIEDNAHEARLLREQLRDASEPVELEHVDRVSAAAERLARGGIDVVLLDLKLRDSSGLATLDRVQACAMGAPVVVLTGTSDEKLAVALVRRGAQDYLVKGTFSDRELLRALRYAVARTEVERARIEVAEKARQVARLTEMTEFKMRLVNTAAHELRTPMTPIRIQMHLLGKALDNGDLAQAARGWHILERNWQRLGHLVDEVVDVAKLEAGRLKVHLVRVDLNEIVAEAVEAFGAPAADAGVALRTGHRGPLVVDGDAARLYQVMINLLGNALRFTPRDGHVAVDAEADGKYAVVRVSDDGIGIPEEAMARLFQPFSQVHDLTKMRAGGSGLGLYICKGIVEEHGGVMRAESGGEGKGATFEVRLPLAAA